MPVLSHQCLAIMSIRRDAVRASKALTERTWIVRCLWWPDDGIEFEAD